MIKIEGRNVLERCQKKKKKKKKINKIFPFQFPNSEGRLPVSKLFERKL